MLLGLNLSGHAVLIRFFALGPAALISTAVLAQATAPVQPVPAIADALSPLAAIPGITIRYYDVAGNTIPAINASMAAQRPKNPVTGAPLPSTATWSMGVSTRKATTGKACKITAATVTFKGEVALPRLVGAEGVPAQVRAQWQKFVASIEQQQAAALRQPYQRRNEVQKAVMASTCENASEAARKTIAEITRATPTPAATTP